MSNDEKSTLKPLRPEIQGLRACAVISVLLYHLWPPVLPGGFIGVDVFFVISGYLITGLLLREAEKSGSISLSAFYARRVRRLLPAAMLVLFVVAAATPLLPRPVWQATAQEIAASALYFENWLLAWLTIDYLGAENAASPVQHYWSLSIEEQFYIVWPLIILGGCMLAVRQRWSLRTILFLTLSLIVAGSFAASVFLTRTEPAAAYFLTHTRIWELALGGLLAMAKLPKPSPRVAEFLRVAGLAAIATAAISFSRRTPFPGYAALLPTLGAACIIAAGNCRPRWSLWTLLAARPIQYLGDTSYSLYLWHWPLIIFYLALADEHAVSPFAGLFLIFLLIVLSHITKRQVEDRFRYGATESRDSIKVFAFSAAVVTACVFAAGAMYFRPVTQPTSAEPHHRMYPGAMAWASKIDVPEVEVFYPPLEIVKKDMPRAYEQGCHVPERNAALKPCEYGAADGDFHIVVIGDSHAASWIPALRLVAMERGWRLTTQTKSSCALLGRRLSFHDRPGANESCRRWGRLVVDWLRVTKPDAVVITQIRHHWLFRVKRDEDHVSHMADAIASTWDEIRAMDIQIIAIADTPFMPFDPTTCVARRPNCAADMSSVFTRDDPILLARAKNSDSVGLLDMNDLICDAERCPAVIGNVIVWRDRHHLTASYARTLAPILGERLETLLSTERPPAQAGMTVPAQAPRQIREEVR